jgi:hypothetical protein
MTKITIWEAETFCRKDKVLKFKHNHIENGWSKEDSPKAEFVNQEKAWKTQKWRKFYGYLMEDNVVKGVDDHVITLDT